MPAMGSSRVLVGAEFMAGKVLVSARRAKGAALLAAADKRPG